MFRKILFPTDGSDHALKAARYLVSLKKEVPDLDVTVLNVWRITPDYRSLETPYAPGLADSVRMMSQRALQVTVDVLEAGGLKVDAVSREGEPIKEILDLAEEGGYDHIVMGFKGHGALAGVVLGSVAQRVLQMASLPVVIVK